MPGEFSSPEHVKKRVPTQGLQPCVGEEAVELGWIDRIGGLADALESLHQMIEERKSSAESSP